MAIHTPRPGGCARCGYDLRGDRGGRRCPECGQLLTDGAVAAAREHRLLRRLGGWGVVAAIAGAALGPALVFLLAEHALWVAPALVLLVAPLLPALVAAWVDRRLSE